MSTLERGQSSSAILHDLYQKKQNLRRIASEVGTMATELRDMRTRMASQESSLEQETSRREAAEAKAKTLEWELEHLKNSLEEKTAHMTSTASVAEQYLRELVDVRVKLGSAQEAAEANATAAALAESQCATLVKEIELKSEALQEHDAHAAEMSQQLADVQQELRAREISQKHLKDEVERLENEVKVAVSRVVSNKELDQKNALEELSFKNAEQLSKLMNAKDDEIGRMREEIRLLSAQVRLKAQDLESQVEKHRTSDQELKKRMLKLEFWLQEARTQTRKYQKIAEKREKEIKDLRAQLVSNTSPEGGVQSVWNNQRLKVLMSVSVVLLALFAKR
ncbi:hypothetical protein L7F22_017618 [Adiantum nelumboides]|nr:hypothetical protein [Adiantum nelumboides]